MDKMREEFEDWAKQEGIDVNVFSDDEENSGQYYFLEAHCAWLAWKASRAALCVNLPKFEDGSLRGYSGDCEEARIVVDCIAESLEEAGISYK